MRWVLGFCGVFCFLSVWHGIRARFRRLLSGVCASWRFQHFLLVICGFLVIAVGVFLGFDPFSSCVWGMYLSSLWVTDDMHHVEAGNNSRILGDLMLRVIEVGRHCNNSILQVEPRWLRSWVCHQNQDQERPWMTNAWDHSEPRHQRIFYQSTFGIKDHSKVGWLFPLHVSPSTIIPSFPLLSFACNVDGSGHKMWHRHLGHPNSNVLRTLFILQSKGIIS